MLKHHYQGQPAYCFWPNAVSDVPATEIDPMISVPFTIDRTTRVATLGSCFAQHVARHLRLAGFVPYATEHAHPLASPALAEQFGYGMFTARYGNVYTSRQLVQLFQRAHGTFVPEDDWWEDDSGKIVDPFRPRIQPGGFKTLAEYRADRLRHFAATREAFANLDVLVYTMGLTEGWVSREDGSAYPLCPGVAGGTFDPSRHAFLNLDVEDVVRDVALFIELLRSVNPSARLILTVSPVPIKATAMDRHVLVSSTFTKSVLRVACDVLARRHEGVAYFPSYEVVTGPQARGRYYAPDSRSVTEEGLHHVMRLFLSHFAGHALGAAPVPDPAAVDAERHAAHVAAMAEVVEALCDEEAIEAGA